MADTLTTVEILIYSRQNCCLCDEAKRVIRETSQRHSLPVILTEVDIDAQPELCARYSDQVPVIFVDGRKAFKYRVNGPELVERIERSMRSGGRSG